MKINKAILSELPLDKLVAVTKYIDVNLTNELIDLGVTRIGENRVNTLLEKLPFLKEVEIHFIGHLQRNKVKQIINEIDCLHSLDSLELAILIEKYRNEPLDCFIEINLGEASKNGIEPHLLNNFIHSLKKYDKIRILGLMGMAHQGDEEQIRSDFEFLSELNKKHHFKYLSMGMSDDYKIALEYGSTHIRLGRLLLED